MKNLSCFIFLITFSIHLHAQSIVENIHTGTVSQGYSIQKPFQYNGILLFQANEGTSGRELRKMYGTASLN